MKLSSPDYKARDPEEAVMDFQMRIKNYELRYETLDHVQDKCVFWNSNYSCPVPVHFCSTCMLQHCRGDQLEKDIKECALFSALCTNFDTKLMYMLRQN